MLNIRATEMYYEAPMSNYPDNFSGLDFDQRWGHDEDTADWAVRDLRRLLDQVRGIPRDSTCEDALNGLEDAFNDAIGEIERNRA